MTIADGIKRSFPVLVALILLALGWWAGQTVADFYLSKQCLPTEGRFVTGGLGAFATVVSIVFGASKDGFLHLENLFRFVRGDDVEKKYHWLSNGVVLGAAAFAFTGLLSFSYGAAFRDCPLPACESKFEMCTTEPRTARDCWLCNVQAELPDAIAEVQAIRRDINRIQLERIGAFPLLFENAGTEGDKLSQRGVQLAPDQLANWHRKLFGDTPWPAAATRDVAYCVVGFSSKAPFAGRKDSNELNVRAAQCRADSVAAELPSVLDQAAPQIASCRWCSYGAMARPRVRPGEHLATSDKHLISRSVFVHGLQLPLKDGLTVGGACRDLVAQKLGVKTDALWCSTFDEGDRDDNQCPPEGA